LFTFFQALPFQSLLSKVREDPAGQDEIRVLVVTHGGWIREMLGVFNRLGCKFPEHLVPTL
jgi:hypothetical protein